ncbi:MAG TPA: tetratricopeptide repeat protein [Blastocatellia bacterium]|nr:tetratricopeptide repeat protein [Blastocatellia bacterium]
MRKRIFSAVVIVLCVASVTVATLVAQRAAQRAKTTTPSAAGGQTAKGKTPANRNAAVTPTPLRQADPNRAPQAAVDEALYTREEFFGTQASVARPYAVALERVGGLLTQYPKDARLHLHAARLSERLGQFDKAATEMAQYADLRRRSPDALRRLAVFYHNRARFADEVKTLAELARALPVTDRAPIYKQAAGLVRSYSLKEYKPADFFAELVAADPSNIQPVKDYVEELELAEDHKAALDVLTTFQPKFSGQLAYFLKTRAAILEAQGDRRAAEQIYDAAFDPTWPRAISGDYYELLRRFGRYRTVRRALQERARTASDLNTVARLFSIYSYEGNFEPASRLLRDLEARRTGVTASWTGRELETVAALFASVGDFDQASRYLYTLYLTGGLQAGSASREEALHRLFRVMLDAAGTPTRVAAGDLSLYKDVAQVDAHPGFMNGVLSLILSGTDPASEFATQEKAAASYFNRAFAYRIFTAFKQEYAQSQYLADMYLGVTEVFAGLGEHRLAIAAGREFQQLYPNSPRYSEVSLRIADAYVALKDRASERAVLDGLLDRLARSRPKGQPLIASSSKRWTYGISPVFDKLVDRIRYNIEAYSDTYDPTEDSSATNSNDNDSDVDSDEPTSFGNENDKRGPTYSSVLERYVASLAADDKKTETVAFFWNEIRKHPGEEGLYERFLRWLGSAELVNEQLKAYNTAIRQFDSNTWYHRLARWYVRQKRGRELQRYSRQLISIFDEEDITEFLLRFAGYGATAAGDSLNWDQKLAFDLYSYAHQRFPQNLYFVRGMLTYLANNKDFVQWAQLSAQYYFADRSIREPFLAYLSGSNELRNRYATAKSKGATATNQPATEPPNTYRIFAADAALWLSHHDEAIDAYRQLAVLYPGEAQYADRLADLTRSFGQRSDKLYEESAQVLAHMADLYPSNHSYRIKAGEVYAELGDFKRAGAEWNKLTALEPGERNTYLEVATVFWDYYQFDEAIRIFKELRQQTGDPTIYAYRMGAVYEGKGDIDAAIAEYVKVLPEPGDGRDTVAKRLAQLSRRTGLADKIAAAYNQARVAKPDDWQLVIGYALYNAEREHQAEALAGLRTEVSRSTNVEFLESVRDLFQYILRPEDEQQVITRLTQVARDEREAMTYRLQLAAFLERHNQVDEAIKNIDKLVADYPTNVGVVEESAQFYWRAGLLDRALDLYKRTLARAQGPNRRLLTLQYARRLSEANKLADAEATLRAFYNENRSDTEVFSELARTLGAENKMNDLATLYQDAFKDVKDSGLTGDDAKAQVAELRLGLIRTYTALNKFAEAVDQHIEIINLFPEDAERLATAYEYAEAHNLLDRLTAYYEKLTKDSYKNYRWQLVLGRIYERRGNLAGATEQFRNAVTNEPERADFRLTLANLLTRQRRYDDAIAVLREGWRLAGRDPSWLTEVARIQVLQGKREEAVQTLRQALASKKETKVTDQIAVAQRLASWGLYAEAVRIYETALAAYPKVMKDEYLGGDAISGYVQALVRTQPVAQVYQKLERMRAQYAAIGDNSSDTDGYRAKNVVQYLDSSLRAEFARGVIDYAGSQDAAAVAQAIVNATAKMTAYTDADALRRYLGIARAANLVDVEEKLQTRLKDAAYAARPKNAPQPTREDTSFYNELRALVAFYDRHAAYAKAAEVLSAEAKRDPYKDRFDYQNQIATQYRLAGDTPHEMESLRVAYQSVSGAEVTTNADWVERYLNLLYAANQRDELERIAATNNPYQLQVINFFIEKNDKALARRAINSATHSTAWKASRSGEVGLFARDTSAETEGFFKSALDIKTIGNMLNRKVDGDTTLLGDDWFVAARNYGYWLGLTPQRSKESLDFIAGEIEGHPSSEKAQLELAAYYLDHKDLTRAAAHTELAAELAPASTDVIITRGLIAMARGDRKAAVEQWNRLLSGRVSVADAQTYLKLMADNNMLREALPPLENFIVSFVNYATRRKNSDGDTSGLDPLVRDIANRARGDAKLANDVATFFHTTITELGNNTSIGQLLIDENLLPEAAQASIYRALHQRLSDHAAATFGTSGDESSQAARELGDFRRKFIDYMIRNRQFDEARLLVATIKHELSDARLALKADGGDDSGATEAEARYNWLPLASALIELRSGKDTAKAIAELRSYCGLDSEGKPSDVAQEDGSHVHGECINAYNLLLAEGREADADALLYDAYRVAARSRTMDEGSLAGLAEIEARRNHAEEASRWLRLLVEGSTDNLRALQLAAETAARIAHYSEAIDFREQLARANPDDATNRLELARVIAASGKAGDALERIATLITETGTPNRVRAQAAETVADLVRADRSLAARAASLFEAKAAQGDAGALLALAAAREAAGNANEARAALSRITAGSLAAVAQLKLGNLALTAGNQAEAAASFERSLYLDADGEVTDAIAYAVAGPRAQLIALYSRTSRDLAAVRLAEEGGDSDSEQNKHALLSSAVRRALTTQSTETNNAEVEVSFQPSMDVARARSRGLRTVAELNDAAVAKLRVDLVAALVESAARLGQLDRAIALERLRAIEARKPDEKTAIEKRLAELLAAEQARQSRAAQLLRVDAQNTSGAIFTARVIGR